MGNSLNGLAKACSKPVGKILGGRVAFSFLGSPTWVSSLWASALSPQGAFWGLMSGLGVGLLRMILEFSYPAPACGEVDLRPAVLKDFHYLYFALLLCGLTAIVIVSISLCTTPIPEEKASVVLTLGPPQKCSSLPPKPIIPSLSFTLLDCGLLCGCTDVLGKGNSLGHEFSSEE